LRERCWWRSISAWSLSSRKRNIGGRIAIGRRRRIQDIDNPSLAADFIESHKTIQVLAKEKL
jgi:hypothetical protein